MPVLVIDPFEMIEVQDQEGQAPQGPLPPLDLVVPEFQEPPAVVEAGQGIRRGQHPQFQFECFAGFDLMGQFGVEHQEVPGLLLEDPVLLLQFRADPAKLLLLPVAQADQALLFRDALPVGGNQFLETRGEIAGAAGEMVRQDPGPSQDPLLIFEQVEVRLRVHGG